MSHLQKKLESYPVSQGYHSFKVEKGQQYCSIRFSDEVDFGIVNAQTACALDAIVSEPSVYFEAFVLARECHNILRRARKPSEATLTVDIYVCGSADVRGLVGDRLSTAKVYLQRIEHQAEKYHYDNPHFIRFPGFNADAFLETSGESIDSMRLSETEKLHRKFAEVCNSLQRDGSLKRIEKDVRIKSSLLEYVGNIPKGLPTVQRRSLSSMPGFSC